MLSPPLASAETYVELFFVDYAGQLGKNLYAEQTLTRNTSALLNHYEDDFYESTYAGLARQIGDVQVGLGLGEARYDDTSHFAYNPWLWYQKNGWEGYVEYEYPPSDNDNYYYRGYLYKDIGSYLFAGVYSERNVGSGPVVGVKFEAESAGVVFNIVKPTFNKPGMGGDPTSWVGYVTAWVSF